MNNQRNLLVAVLVLIFVLLFLRLIYLQIAENEKYAKLAIENAAKTVPEPAPRGIIYDRFGKVMVENRPIFSVHILPHILFNKDKTEQERILNKLENLLGEKVELRVSATEPIIIKDNVPLKIAVQVEEKRMELPGVFVRSRPVRFYPYSSLASHVIGYVGEIEARELQTLKAKGYRLKDVIGKDGIEKIYDKKIRGIDGGKKIEVDVYGMPVRILESLDPIPGADVQMTLDLALQQAVEKALGNHEGAVVVMNVKNGEILSLASHPNYDPNLFADALQNWQWKELKNKRHPFINRALALYPPGSIFKVVTLTAALEEGLAKPNEVLYCPGYYRINNRLAKCWKEKGHGLLTVAEGLVWSCDVVFYELGRRLGPERLAQYAHKFGLGSLTNLDLPQEKQGTVPTEAWKKKYLGEPWYEGDSINYGIGQGFLQVTPLQMALVYASVASGNIFKPYLVSEIKEKNGKILYQGKKEIAAKLPFASSNLNVIRQALEAVVSRGTGIAARVPGLPAAGKTGTAENPGKAHAWFICYAPASDPQIVIAVFVAHGEHGDRIAAHIARDILNFLQSSPEYASIKNFAGELKWQKQ